MKKLGLSLATAIAISSSSIMANNNFVDALTNNAKIDGEIRFLHTQGNHSDVAQPGLQINTNDASVALELNYTTGSFYGFKFGVSVETSYDFGLHDKDGGLEDDPRNTVSATGIHELFLDYNFSKSSIKVGRQEIRVPLIMSSHVFPMRDSFDSAVVDIKEIPNTLVKLIYIDKWVKRFASDSNDTSAQNDTEYPKGLYSIYLRNNSYKPLVIDAQYMITDENRTINKGVETPSNGDGPFAQTDGYSQYYVRTDYKLPISYPLNLGFLYAGASFDKKDEKNANVYGVKLSSKIADVGVSASYVYVTDDNNYPGTLSHAPDVLLYTNNELNKPFYAGTDSYSLQLDYKLSENIKTKLFYTHMVQSKDEEVRKIVKNYVGKSDEVALWVWWDLKTVLKGLSTAGVITIANHDDYKVLTEPGAEGSRATYGKIYVTYKF